jgi:hypothetical protein
MNIAYFSTESDLNTGIDGDSPFNCDFCEDWVMKHLFNLDYFSVNLDQQGQVLSIRQIVIPCALGSRDTIVA